MATYVRIGNTIFDLERVTMASLIDGSGVAGKARGSVVNVGLGGETFMVTGQDALKLWAFLQERVPYTSVGDDTTGAARKSR